MIKPVPTNIFENYTLNKSVGNDVGLTQVDYGAFQSLSNNVSNPLADDVVSNLTNIGFDFSFDQKTYKNFIVSTNGWMVLCDPIMSSSTQITGSLLLSGTYQNEGININHNTNNLFLAPWFDDLENISNQPSTGVFITQTNLVNSQKYGSTPPRVNWDEKNLGPKYYIDQYSTEGRRLIVRWDSLSDFNNASNILKFEVVVYENGKIEYRYAPKKFLSNVFSSNETATVGIFGTGVKRFRDFSFELGYKIQREKYKYGGEIYNSNFVDSGIDPLTSKFISRNYVWQLNSANNWAGTQESGAVFQLSPPQNKKRILPKLEIKKQDFLEKKNIGAYNDQRSVNFITGTVVNYPTRLNRFITQDQFNNARQNLFGSAGNELEITGSIDKNTINQFLIEFDTTAPSPFSEDANFASDPSAQDNLYFISGSLGTPTPLWNKSKLKMSFPVNNTVQMFERTSSLYYFNTKTNSFNLPQNSSYYNENTVASNRDLANPSNFTTISKGVFEDNRGFSAIGSVVSSGSNLSSTTQSDIVFNLPFIINSPIATLDDGLRRVYSKTLFTNPNYNPTPDEVFKTNLKNPFIIEKAIVKIPFIMENDWFSDKTQAFSPLLSTTGSFDLGGPCLTISLLHNVKNGDGTSTLNLIMSGTIIPVNDFTSSVDLRNFAPKFSDYYVRPVGFLGYSNNPSVVVSPNVGTVFSGTVSVPMESLISNGYTLRMFKDMFSGSSEANKQELLSFIQQPQLSLISSSVQYGLGYNILYVNPYGRGKKGSEISGRSIIGNEFTTFQGVFQNGKTNNPFYLSSSLDQNFFSSSLTSVSKVRALTALNLQAHTRSPYLLNPDDELILAVSKTRPYYFSNLPGLSEFSGSATHTVKFAPGKIDLTLYGSYLQSEKEIYLNPEPNSNVIYKAIGDDQVIDQYDVSYLSEFISGSSDDMITGSLVIKDPNDTKKLILGNRGRVASKVNARNATVYSAESSYSYTIQSQWERANSPRFSQCIDYNERFFDSLAPSITECVKINGGNISFYNSDAITALSSSIDLANIGIFTVDFANGGDPILNRSFPFEPRYSTVSRLKNFNQSFIANSVNGFNGSIFTFNLCQPTPVRGLIIESVAPNLLVRWATDIKINAPSNFNTGSLSILDTLKVVYGIGDLNSNLSSNIGTTQAVDWRNNYVASNGTTFSQSPIIRGLKYGLKNLTEEYNRAYFLRNHFGHIRDMLEQRSDSKFLTRDIKTRSEHLGLSPITVRFLDSDGKNTAPENTNVNNLHFECSSSLPYFDGTSRSRNDINLKLLNNSIQTLTTNNFGQTKI